MASPHRSLPPLDLLRGFESAARHLSFTRAAAELFLTQSAVSRQIQALEAFVREQRGRGLAPRSVARSVAAIRGFYRFAFGEGLIPVKVKMTIEGDQLSYDLTGSHPAIGSFINAGFGSSFSRMILITLSILR